MKRANIMIVEDDRVVARDIRQQLQRMGHAVVAATADGEQAVALAAQARAELVLMDIRLGGRVDGVEAARRLRAQCEIPVIFLTAYADDETLRRAGETEPYGYLLKPFEDSQLRTTVEMALYKHAAEQRLRESERALRAAEAEVARVAQLTRMSELAAAIAHEINQPLAAIVANAGAGLNWLRRDPPDLAETREVLESIRADGHRAAETIRSLRALSRRAGPSFACFDLSALVREVAELSREALRERGVRLNLEGVLPGISVHADRVQIRQVLHNLVTNAMDAMAEVPAGERWLILSVASAQAQGTATVTVSDTGVGLPAGDTRRLLEPFFTTKAHGMGMGLAICRGILEAHESRLALAPSTPRGAAFSFELRLDDLKSG